MCKIVSKNLKFFFFILCVFFYSSTFSQSKSNKNDIDTTSIYYKALKLHLDYVEKVYLSEKTTPPDYWNIDMETPSQWIGGLPNTIGHFRINYMDQKEIKRRVRKYHCVYLIHMDPIFVKNNIHTFGIGNFTMTIKKGKLNYGNNGGTMANFKYDNLSGIYTLIDLQQGTL